MAIGTTALAVLGGLGTAAVQAGSAKRAAQAQERVGGQQLELSERIYDETTGRFAPYAEAGRGALDAYRYEMGLGAAPEGYTGIEASPAHQFLMQQGVKDIQSSAAARGKLGSGATLTALERYRMGLATQDRDMQLGCLSGLAGMGQASAGMQAASGQAYGQMAGSALANIGESRAAGHIGVGQGIASGINTGMGLYGYLDNLQPRAMGGAGR